nr:hypothetical protein [Shewanella submarina]
MKVVYGSIGIALFTP